MPGAGGGPQVSRIQSDNSMAEQPEIEIIPPGAQPRPRRPAAAAAPDQLATLARLLDDVFEIPGTGIRFGLDPLLGLIPGLGDALSGLLSALIVAAAWQRGLPHGTVYRMVANIAIDSLLGTVPVLGDVFDVTWKANRRNYELLRRTEAEGHRHTWKDWLFVVVLGLAILGLALLPFALLALVVRKLWA